MRRTLLVLFLALLAGCSNAAPTAKTPTKGTVAISIMSSQNPFFNVIAKTFQEDAEKAGYKVLVVSGDNNQEKQNNQVKDFLVQKVRAIVLCPCDCRAVGASIREANAAGVPVFTADLACLDDTAQVVAHVATDNYNGGELAAVAMAEALGESGGKIAVLNFDEAESCILRVKGFQSKLAELNKAAKNPITIVTTVGCGGDREKGFNAAQTALTQHADLAGIFAINDPAALGAAAAVDIAKKTAQVKIVGFDGQPDGKKAIRDGVLYADPIQFPDRIAHKTFETIQQYLAGEKTQKEFLIPTGLYRKKDGEADPELR